MLHDPSFQHRLDMHGCLHILHPRLVIVAFYSGCPVSSGSRQTVIGPLPVASYTLSLPCRQVSVIWCSNPCSQPPAQFLIHIILSNFSLIRCRLVGPSSRGTRIVHPAFLLSLCRVARLSSCRMFMTNQGPQSLHFCQGRPLLPTLHPPLYK